MSHKIWSPVLPLLAAFALSGAAVAQNAPACKDGMRKISIGVSVSPTNVVHTTPYVAKELGLFAQRCIEPNIIQFDGGESPAATAAVAQGTAIANVTDVAIGRGMKARQMWGFAPKPPQIYVVAENIKTAADLKGKRLSAAGGGVGSFNWRMGREVLRTAGLDVADVQFISQGTAGRLAGLVAGQIEGVSLHPEDVYLAMKQKPGVHALATLSELMPLYMFNAYGASTDWIAKDRALMRDTLAAMIEANRTIYRDKDKVLPIMIEATTKPKEAVEYAWETLTKNCIWAVNEGFDQKRTEWTVDNDVSTGDIDAAKKPTFDQVVDLKLAQEAVEAAGGRTTIGNCKD
ncbi:MAG: NitT/TauT family transport system substrate-binding protein [Alphaproteobacteria bacterium]|nr:NitT/TauT family transport system substrate-binding protein [Alphaproteobacteria bacterium]